MCSKKFIWTTGYNLRKYLHVEAGNNFRLVFVIKAEKPFYINKQVSWNYNYIGVYQEIHHIFLEE